MWCMQQNENVLLLGFFPYPPVLIPLLYFTFLALSFQLKVWGALGL